MTDKNTTCCFTGHRSLPPDRLWNITARLETAVEFLICQGIEVFRAGGAIGFDTIAALTVLKLRKKYPHVSLVLVLPCKDQTRYWPMYHKILYEKIRDLADVVTYTAQYAHRGCMHVRNRNLVDHSAWCVYCLLRQCGGTKFTVEYARQKGLCLINVADDAPVKNNRHAQDQSASFMKQPRAALCNPGQRNAGMYGPAQSVAEPSAMPLPPDASNRELPVQTMENLDVCSLAFRMRIAARNRQTSRTVT